jgi:V/A-type H+/Na+-transporting ATPase subunit A
MTALNKTGEAMLKNGGSINDFLNDANTLEKVGRARFVPENEFPAYMADYMKSLETAFKATA